MSSIEITAESIVQVARQHGFTLDPGNHVTLDVDGKLCCAIGATALLIEPGMAQVSDWRAARALVTKKLGRSALDGLEDGFEGWHGITYYIDDPESYNRYRAIGKAAAEMVEPKD